MIAENDFDCVRCGACCVATPPPPAGEGYVAVTAADLRRLPASYRDVAAQATPPRLPVRAVGGVRRCAALAGKLGTRVACTIYDARPRGCRQLQPGSRACKILRELVLEIVDD